MKKKETVERVVPGELSWEEYGLEHQQRYEYFKSYYAGKKILDCACGSGYGSFYISNSGASSVLGIDIAEDIIEANKSNYKNSNLQYKKEDCTDLRVLKETFDVIVSFETIEHLTDPLLFIKSAKESLNPGGIFICSTPNKMRLSGAGHINKYHLHELHYEEFYQAMAESFEIVSCLHQTETREYQRYMEVKFMIGTAENRLVWYFFPRIENMIRKMLGKSFEKVPYINPTLGFQYEGDMEILPMAEHKDWHKTFIIIGRKKL